MTAYHVTRVPVLAGACLCPVTAISDGPSCTPDVRMCTRCVIHKNKVPFGPFWMCNNPEIWFTKHSKHILSWRKYIFLTSILLVIWKNSARHMDSHNFPSVCSAVSSCSPVFTAVTETFFEMDLTLADSYLANKLLWCESEIKLLIRGKLSFRMLEANVSLHD